jgi:hypothetical protein
MKKYLFSLGEIPLAIASFLFYKVMKLSIGILYTGYLYVNQDKSQQWRILSQETIDSTLSLPVLMTKGPRWNTHAIIGTLGPFSIQESLEIDILSPCQSAQSWIAVIYSFPTYKTIGSITSKEFFDKSLSPQDKWHKLNLKAGKYSLGIRYYNTQENIYLPQIKINGNNYVSPQPVSPNINDFYHNLIKRKNFFYSALHYYIFTILKYKNNLPKKFIHSEFLPVGAPDTQFIYNYLLKESVLEVEIKQEILEKYNIYLTVYDRCSLPVEFTQIQTEKYITKPLLNNGYYLFRIRPKIENISVVDNPLNYTIQDENSPNQKVTIG